MDYNSDDELNEEYIIPGAFDKRVALVVAEQVAKVAEQLGIARNPGNREFWFRLSKQGWLK